MIQSIKKNKKLILLLSFFSCLVSLGVLCVYGLNLGLEFTGGVEIEISLDQQVSIERLASIVNRPKATVTNFGSSLEFLIKIPELTDIDEMTFKKQLISSLSNIGVVGQIDRLDIVGSEFSEAMFEQSITALLVAFLAITFYIAIRFEMRLALSALLALLFDPIIILGSFSFFQWTFDAATLAGLLAVIGYSINDTIVVFDRVRENFQRIDADSETIFYTSIEQTMKRTIITSLLTFMVVLALLIVGTASLQGFSLALAIGIVVGTFSSIIVAGPLALLMGIKKEHLFPIEDKDDVNESNI